MKCKKFYAPLLLLAINSHCALADIPYVSNAIITSLTLADPNSPIYVNAEADITLTNGTISGSYTTCSDSALDDRYFMGVIVYPQYSYGESNSQLNENSTHVNVSCGDKYSDVIDRWKNAYGTSIRAKVNNQNLGRDNIHHPDEIYPKNGYKFCLAIGNIYGWAHLIPGIACQVAPSPPSYCNSLPDMLFDHGTISQGTNLQNTKIVNATLSCTATASVTLSLSSPIKLDKGIINHFYVNNKKLDSTPVTVSITNNNTPLQFSSVIESAANGGSFSGSSVLIMAVN